MGCYANFAVGTTSFSTATYGEICASGLSNPASDWSKHNSFFLKNPSVRYLASVIQFGALSHCLLEHVVEVQMVGGCCSALISPISDLTTLLYPMNVVLLFKCVGPSMLPTFNTIGDIVIVDRLSSTRNVRKGNVVVSNSPVNPGQTICKRVAGLPGDRMVIGTPPWHGEVIVPPGHVWLLGDNPWNSSDSRKYAVCLKSFFFFFVKTIPHTTQRFLIYLNGLVMAQCRLA